MNPKKQLNVQEAVTLFRYKNNIYSAYVKEAESYFDSS